MISLGSDQYLDGGIVLVADLAPYVGTNMSAKGNPRFKLIPRLQAQRPHRINLICFGRRLRCRPPGN